jgi:peptide/nickel transport system ATP-binding protein
MSEPLLAVSGLVKHFPLDKRRSVRAVNDVSFEIRHGEALALVGESGSGKTTIGRCILRLIEPTAGSILFRGQEVTRLEESAFRVLRPRLQMVFQEPYNSLSPRMRIRKALEEPLLLNTDLTPAQRLDRVVEVLEMVRLGAAALDRYPHQFSGGQQQRIGVARALVTSPDLIVLDEPTSALDVCVRAEILDLLNDLQRRLGFSYLFISHDLAAVRRVCDRVAIMYLGKIVETASVDEIFARPLHPYTRALLSSVLYPDPKLKPPRFRLEGEIPSSIHLPTGCHLRERCPWATPSCGAAYPPLDELSPGRRVACFRVGGPGEPNAEGWRGT